MGTTRCEPGDPVAVARRVDRREHRLDAVRERPRRRPSRRGPRRVHVGPVLGVVLREGAHDVVLALGVEVGLELGPRGQVGHELEGHLGARREALLVRVVHPREPVVLEPLARLLRALDRLRGGARHRRRERLAQRPRGEREGPREPAALHKHVGDGLVLQDGVRVGERPVQHGPREAAGHHRAELAPPGEDRRLGRELAQLGVEAGQGSADLAKQVPVPGQLPRRDLEHDRERRHGAPVPPLPRAPRDLRHGPARVAEVLEQGRAEPGVARERLHEGRHDRRGGAEAHDALLGQCALEGESRVPREEGAPRRLEVHRAALDARPGDGPREEGLAERTAPEELGARRGGAEEAREAAATIDRVHLAPGEAAAEVRGQQLLEVDEKDHRLVAVLGERTAHVQLRSHARGAEEDLAIAEVDVDEAGLAAAVDGRREGTALPAMDVPQLLLEVARRERGEVGGHLTGLTPPRRPRPKPTR
jgi:hypothetical protein